MVRLATRSKSGQRGSNNVNTRKHKWRENERCWGWFRFKKQIGETSRETGELSRETESNWTKLQSTYKMLMKAKRKKQPRQRDWTSPRTKLSSTDKMSMQAKTRSGYRMAEQDHEEQQSEREGFFGQCDLAIARMRRNQVPSDLYSTEHLYYLYIHTHKHT
jgi:hypothetical protein